METSVIIPVCNRLDELTRAIKSILRQTERVGEIIVVENNSRSPGEIKDVCDSFNEDRIFFHSLQQCENANVARNFGAKRAAGDVIFFLDSDDEWDADHVSNCLHLIRKSECEFVYGGARIFDGEKVRVKPSRPLEKDERPVDFVLGFGGGYAQTSSYAILKQSFMKIQWDERLKRHQDYDFFIRAANDLKIAYNSKPDYTIYWLRSERRSFDLPSVIRFVRSARGAMSTSTKFRYILMMLKIGLNNHDLKSILVILRHVLYK